MVSDGGMVNGYGSYGWIIANKNEITKGRGEAEGARNLMQSFRAEGYAFRYTENWPEQAKTIHMYCDNLSYHSFNELGGTSSKLSQHQKTYFDPTTTSKWQYKTPSTAYEKRRSISKRNM
jgi:hypothetical protein